MTHAIDQEVRIGEVLNDRYEVLRELGHGGQGRTYLGIDRHQGEQIAIKELHLGRVTDWKMLELFEREGRVLEGLSHPQVPRYVDSFRLERSGEMRFFLVQEFVAGESLEALVEDGLHLQEAQARGFIEEMLGILEYLHGLHPPVVHRDIKPSNIMKRATDERWVLIDFGAVQRRENFGEGGNSTIVGTSGYMALEQLMGRSVPATDLYGLGATVVYMLSGRHPSDLPVDGLKLDFGAFVNVSSELKGFLGRMLEPYVEERFTSASDALVALSSTGRDVVIDTVDEVIGHVEQSSKDVSSSFEIVFGNEVVREDFRDLRTQWDEEKRLLAARETEIRALARAEQEQAAGLMLTDEAGFRGKLSKTQHSLEIRMPIADNKWDSIFMHVAFYSFLGSLSLFWQVIRHSGDMDFFILALICLIPSLAFVGREVLMMLGREVLEIRTGILSFEKGGLLEGRTRVDLPVRSIRAVALIKKQDLQARRARGIFSKDQVNARDAYEIAISSARGVELTFGGHLYREEQRYVVREILEAIKSLA